MFKTARGLIETLWPAERAIDLPFALARPFFLCIYTCIIYYSQKAKEPMIDGAHSPAAAANVYMDIYTQVQQHV